MRIHGRISLAAALLWAGLAHADKPEATKKKADDAKIIMLTGSDGKPHKCQVIKTSKHSSGGIALEVKDLETGEMMTVIDKSGTATQTASVAPTKTQTTAAVPTTAQLAATTSTTPKTKTTTTELASTTSTTAKSKSTIADPIMQPKELASKKAQQLLTGEVAKPAKTEKKLETSATKSSSWWSGKPMEAKVSQSKPAIAIVSVPPIEAIRHPDPVIRLIGSLRDDLMPSMREIAAETLTQSSGRHRPEVIAALAEAAQVDPAPTVRACCVRCLTSMSTSSPECMAALQKLGVESETVIQAGGSISK